MVLNFGITKYFPRSKLSTDVLELFGAIIRTCLGKRGKRVRIGASNDKIVVYRMFRDCFGCVLKRCRPCKLIVAYAADVEDPATASVIVALLLYF